MQPSVVALAITWNVPRLQRLAAQNPQTPGSVSTGVVARNSIVKPGEVVGSFAAINPATGEKKWEVPLVEMPSAAGMLATDGGLVFTGRLSGEFVALDADTGATLWQFKTGSSVNATAITCNCAGHVQPAFRAGVHEHADVIDALAKCLRQSYVMRGEFVDFIVACLLDEKKIAARSSAI
jgi:outer membrane protein assembly factor BamB